MDSTPSLVPSAQPPACRVGGGRRRCAPSSGSEWVGHRQEWMWTAPSATWRGKFNSFEKTLMLGKTEGGKRRGRQRARWMGGMTDSMDMGLSKLR